MSWPGHFSILEVAVGCKAEEAHKFTSGSTTVESLRTTGDTQKSVLVYYKAKIHALNREASFTCRS